MAKTLTLDITGKVFHRVFFFFITSMLLSSIDFYHCVLLSLTLTSCGGHKVSTFLCIPMCGNANTLQPVLSVGAGL